MSFSTILFKYDENERRLIRNIEAKNKKLINAKEAVVFNNTCIYIYIYFSIFFIKQQPTLSPVEIIIGQVPAVSKAVSTPYQCTRYESIPLQCYGFISRWGCPGIPNEKLNPG